MVAGVRGLTSFTAEMKTLALVPGTRVIAVQQIAADKEIADALEIAVGDPIVQMKRLRLGDGLPIGIQTTHLPATRVPGLLEAAHEVQSLYDRLREHCGISPERAKEVYSRRPGVGSRCRSHPAARRNARLRSRTHRFRSQRPVRIRRLTMRADRYEIRSTLSV